MRTLAKALILVCLYYGAPVVADVTQQCPLSCVGQPPIIEMERPKEVFVDAKAYEVYTESQLISYIRNGTYFQKIRRDQCQIVDDIRANAEVLRQPAFQFLWGEMLIHGVCIRKNVSYGLYWLRSSVIQGLPEGMLKLGRYYHSGNVVIPNLEKAVRLTYTAAKSGNVPSRMFLVELILEGYGSPADYAQAYDWLYHSSFQRKSDKVKSQRLLIELANLLPPSVVYEIQVRPDDNF